MDLFSDVPRPVTWTPRALGWLIGLAIIAVILLKYGSFRLSMAVQECLEKPRSERNALIYGQQLLNCAHAKSGPLERVILYKTKKIVSALPNAPCQYVGTWKASRPGAIYSVTMLDDGSFTAEPIEPKHLDSMMGSWGVNKDKMIWFYDSGQVWPPDINPIQQQSDDAFTLVEADRSTTSYVLVTRVDSKTCSPITPSTPRR